MLNVENLTFAIRHKPILKRLNLSVNTGEHVVILGANGAGKTTLLKVLSGEQSHYEGHLSMNGKSLSTLSPKRLARMRAVMPQETQLNFPFRAREVVEMGSAPHPHRQEEALIVRQCLDLFDVAHLQEQLYPSLSGGEKQRVQLARVFCQLWPRAGLEPPRFLFLDECSSALDPAHQFQVFEVVQAIRKQNVGVVSIVHDLNLAARFADRILLMNKGELIAEGTPEEVLNPHNLERAYGIDTQVLQHPVHAHPLVVSLGRSL